MLNVYGAITCRLRSKRYVRLIQRYYKAASQLSFLDKNNFLTVVTELLRKHHLY